MLLQALWIGTSLAASLTACGEGPAAPPEPTPTAAALVIPEEDALLDPGTYRVSKEGRTGSDPLRWTVVDFTVVLPSGLVGNTGHSVGTPEEWEDTRPADAFGFYPVLVDSIYADSCEGERGATQPVGARSDDLVKALLAQQGTTAGTPIETTIGGRPATRVDLDVPRAADLRSCHLADFGPPALQIWFADGSDKYLVLSPGLRARVYTTEVDGKRQEFLAVHSTRPSAAALQVLDAIVGSIEFE